MFDARIPIVVCSHIRCSIYYYFFCLAAEFDSFNDLSIYLISTVRGNTYLGGFCNSRNKLDYSMNLISPIAAHTFKTLSFSEFQDDDNSDLYS